MDKGERLHATATDVRTKDCILRDIAELEQRYNIKVVFAANTDFEGYGLPGQKTYDWDRNVFAVFCHNKDWYIGRSMGYNQEEIFPSMDNFGRARRCTRHATWTMLEMDRLFTRSGKHLVEVKHWITSRCVYLMNSVFADTISDIAPLRHQMDKFYEQTRDKLVNAGWKLSKCNFKQSTIDIHRSQLCEMLKMHWMTKNLSIPPMCFKALLDDIVNNEEYNSRILKYVMDCSGQLTDKDDNKFLHSDKCFYDYYISLRRIEEGPAPRFNERIKNTDNYTARFVEVLDSVWNT